MKFRVGLAQIKPTLGNINENLKEHIDYIARAKEEDVDLLIFPELSLTGYHLKDLVTDVALDLDSKIIEELRSEARDLALIFGFVEESKHCRFYNSAIYIQNEEIKHIHRKVYLPTYGMFDELRYLARGDNIKAFDTDFGRMGLLICEDFWHPSAAYIAVQDRADYLINISCSPGRGISTEPKLSSAESWERLNRTYAQFFTVYIIYVNRVGYEDGVNFWGGSEIIDPSCKEVLKAEFFAEGLFIAEIDDSVIRRERMVSPMLRDENLNLTINELRRIQDERLRRKY